MDNDEAGAIAADFAASGDVTVLEVAFDDVLAAGSEYLEAPCAQRGLAAAVILSDAIAGGRLHVQAHESAAKALAALERVLRPPSELLELWDESDRRAEWEAEISALEACLSSQAC